MPKESGGVGLEFAKGAAAVAGAAVFTWFMGWLSPIWSFVQWAFESLWTHLMAQSQWPNWSAYFVSAWLLISIVRLAVKKFRNRKDNHNRFSQLSFLGAVWRWNSMSSLPYGLRPYCHTCDTMLVYEHIGGGYYSNESEKVLLHCERCGHDVGNTNGRYTGLQERVTREIDRLVRTGEWVKHVPDVRN